MNLYLVKKWVPYNKGGGYRKWYGLNLLVVDWEDNGRRIRYHPGSVLRNPDFYFRAGITWSGLKSSNVSFRDTPPGYLFNSNKGPMMFPETSYIDQAIGFANSCTADLFLKMLNPTISTQISEISKLPLAVTNALVPTKRLVCLAERDWNSYEVSWDFTTLPILSLDHRHPRLDVTYEILRTHWREMTMEMQHLEEENNRVFIGLYDLQDELSPEVPLAEITLTCNPQYRYDTNKTEDELEALLQADTMREFISYAVGCMFGRYSLDKPGLILANQAETLEDYLRQVPNPTFMPDQDNAIPMLGGDWFTDGITERFKKFLRVTFGEEHYEDNLAFIENALGRDIRNYFLREFYNHHVKMYKKRPIYWLFSSPKGSFNVLICMHRYRPDTVSVVLNDYLREFRTKLNARKAHLEQVSISSSTSQRDKTQVLKEIGQINKTLNELREYEDDILYPLATKQIQIDLDDGVKINYSKFGKALKRITGLTQK